jgi:hypothetical protein
VYKNNFLEEDNSSKNADSNEGIKNEPLSAVVLQEEEIYKEESSKDGEGQEFNAFEMSHPSLNWNQSTSSLVEYKIKLDAKATEAQETKAENEKQPSEIGDTGSSLDSKGSELFSEGSSKVENVAEMREVKMEELSNSRESFNLSEISSISASGANLDMLSNSVSLERPFKGVENSTESVDAKEQKEISTEPSIQISVHEEEDVVPISIVSSYPEKSSLSTPVRSRQASIQLHMTPLNIDVNGPSSSQVESAASPLERLMRSLISETIVEPQFPINAVNQKVKSHDALKDVSESANSVKVTSQGEPKPEQVEQEVATLLVTPKPIFASATNQEVALKECAKEDVNEEKLTFEQKMTIDVEQDTKNTANACQTIEEDKHVSVHHELVTVPVKERVVDIGKADEEGQKFQESLHIQKQCQRLVDKTFQMIGRITDEDDDEDTAEQQPVSLMSLVSWLPNIDKKSGATQDSEFVTYRNKKYQIRITEKNLSCGDPECKLSVILSSCEHNH